MEERDRLEAEKRQEMERLKNESELVLQAASKKLEELKESAQKEMEREKQKLRSDIRVPHFVYLFSFYTVGDEQFHGKFLFTFPCLYQHR